MIEEIALEYASCRLFMVEHSMLDMARIIQRKGN